MPSHEFEPEYDRWEDAEARAARDAEAEHVEHRASVRDERLAEHVTPDFKLPARIIEDQLGWEQLRRAKLRPCRVCGNSWLPQLHHLVSRSLGGDDVPDNLVPLCSDCHGLVEDHDHETLRVLGERLTHREMDYVTGKKGSGYLVRRYLIGVAA